MTSEIEQQRPWTQHLLGGPAGSEATKVEANRAAVEVIASMQAARTFPRDPVAARTAMQKACGDFGLASRAFYAFPKGGTTVTGPTVVLMRALAAIWGNLDYGTQQLSRDAVLKQSEGRAFCRDLETNVYKSRTVIIPWVMYAATKERPIETSRDIDNNDNSVLGRAEREAIEAVLPPAFVEEAKTLCKETLDRGDGRPLPDQVADIVAIFGKARPPVLVATLEDRVGKPVADWSGGDVGRLVVLFQSIRQGTVTRGEAFPDEGGGITSADIRRQAGGEPVQPADLGRVDPAAEQRAAATPSDDEEAAAELDRQRFGQTEGTT